MRVADMDLSEFDIFCFDRAVELALEAERQKNLPIGAVIAMKGEIVSEGKNLIWYPQAKLHRHAEMEALSNLPQDLVERAPEMTLYTTLEPCLMCMGAILLSRIGRVLYGSRDGFGGSDPVIEHLPEFFKQEFDQITWQGPVYQAACDPLFKRIKSLEKIKALGMR